MSKNYSTEYKNAHSVQMAGYTAATATEYLSLSRSEFDALLTREEHVVSLKYGKRVISREFLSRLTGHGKKEACEGCE